MLKVYATSMTITCNSKQASSFYRHRESQAIVAKSNTKLFSAELHRSHYLEVQVLLFQLIWMLVRKNEL